MSERAHIRSIRVDCMLGIGRGQGFELTDLLPTVNILHGPNGSGKTTVGRAMLLALFGGSKEVWKRLSHGTSVENDAELRRAQLAATIGLVTSGRADRIWRWELAGGEVSSLVDGEKSVLSVGSADLAQRYRLGLVELLAESNEEFAREMMRQAAGGIDLDAIAGELAWDRAVPRPRLTDVRHAEERLRHVRNAQSQLATRASRLEAMQRERDQLQARVDETGLIEKSIEVVRARARVASLEAELANVPHAVQQLAGDEASRADGLDQRFADAEAAVRQANEQLARRESQPAQLDEQERACVAASLEPAHAATVAMRDSEDELLQADRSLRDVTQAHRSTAKVLAAAKVPEANVPHKVDATAVADAQRIVGLAHRFDGLKSAHERLQAIIVQLRLSAPSERLPDRDALRKAADALVAWLHAPDRPVVAPTRPPPWAWPAVVAAAIASIALAMLVHGVAFIGVLAAGLAARLVMDRSAGGTSDAAATAAAEAATHRRQFDAFARDARLQSPASWSAEDVQRCHQTLLRLQAQHEVHEASAGLVEAVAQLKNRLADAERELRDHCIRFEQAHGMALDETGGPSESGWMLWVVRAVCDHRQAADHLQRAQSRAEDAKSRIDASRTALVQALHAVGLGQRLSNATISAEAARRLLEALEARRLADAERTRQLESLRQDVLERQHRMQACAEARDAFWARLGLAPVDHASLQGRLRAWQKAGQLRQDLESERRTVERLQAQLAAHDQLLMRSEAQLMRDLEAGQSSRENLMRCMQEVSDLRADIERASNGLDMTEAQATVHAAQEQLHAREQAWLASVMRRQVLAWARESLQQGVAPVIDRAQQLLANFTQGRLAFRVIPSREADTPEIQARGGETEPWRPVQRLSSGERIQLLMAIRLAFLQESEERVLPLFLDEVLGSSDDDRADRIIDSVIGVVSSGRQVFYATAQADEVVKWKTRLDLAGIPHRVIDMAQVRRMQASTRCPLPPALPERSIVPAPHGRSHREYGEALGVPGVDWFEPSLGSLHVWHVIEDPALLHEVLCIGVESLGQLDRLGPSAGDTAVGRAFRCSRVAASAYRVAGQAWRRGRGKPLTLEALQGALGVSDAFRDRIWQRVRAAGCDAQVFMQQLREDPPPRWRDDSTGVLEAWLRAEGHLTDDERVAMDDIAAMAALEVQRLGLDAAEAQATLQRVREMLKGTVAP